MSMSRCSATVLTVCGRVGFVDPGMTCGRPAIVRMSGACPPPAPSTWKAWMRAAVDGADRRLHEPRLVERVRVQGDLQPPLLGAAQRGVERGRGRAPVLVDLVAARAGQGLLRQGVRADRVALAEQQHVDRYGVEGAQDVPQVPRARDRRRLRPLGRARAAARDRRDPRGERLVQLRRRQQVHVRVERPGREDPALAGDDVGRRPDDQVGVDAVGDVRVAGPPRATIRPSRSPTSARTTPHQSRTIAFVITVSSAPCARVRGDCAIDSRIDLPPPNTASSPPAVRSSVDLDPQVGVAEPHLVADRRAVQARRSARGPPMPSVVLLLVVGRRSATGPARRRRPCRAGCREPAARRGSSRRRPGGSHRARTAATYRRARRAGTRAPPPGRTRGRCWRRAGAGGSRSGRAGRRC